MLLPMKIRHTALSVACFFSYGLLAAVSVNADQPEINTPEASVAPATQAPTRQLDINRVLENHRSAIEQKEFEVGPYDPELSEMIYGLGKTLQTGQRYDEAVTAYKRSLHLNRINNGVYSLTQAPMLRGIIESQIKQGLFKETAENYEQLLWIHVKTYGRDDPRLIPLLNEISQWHLNSYSQTGRRVDAFHLEAAFNLYSAAIQLSSEHLGPDNFELIPLLSSLAITSYYYAVHQQLYPEFSDIGSPVPFGYRSFGSAGNDMLRRGSYYLHGRSAHNRILSILTDNPAATPQDKANAYADLGDWYQLFGRHRQAIDAYQEAHKIMEGSQQKDTVLSALFSTPRMLPKLESRQVSSDTSPANTLNNDATTLSLEYATAPDHYVNLSVDVTPQGIPKNLQIQEVHPEGSSDLGRWAKQTIRTRRFRPRFEGGLPVLTNAFPIRVLIPNEHS